MFTCNINSSVTLDNIYSSVTLDNVYSSVTLDNVYSSVALDNVYSSVTLDNIYSSVAPDNVYSSIKFLITSGSPIVKSLLSCHSINDVELHFIIIYIYWYEIEGCVG